MEKTRKKIRLERFKKGYSQNYMAVQLDIGQCAYGKFERGQTKMTLIRLNKIAKILDIDLTELVDLDGLKLLE